TETETKPEPAPETEPAQIAKEKEEKKEIEYVEVSPDNEFIDFEFIEDYQGTTDIGDLADKAVEFLKTTDKYAESMKNISEFSDEEFPDYIVDGVIVPKFRTAYPNDYNGDGGTETFIAVDMPVHYDSNILTSFYIYADCVGRMTLLNVSGKPDENVVFLNYGRDKQIAFGGGISPYGSINYLYGVKYGDPVLLYSTQARLEKRSCFLRSHGFQATESFLYFDTAAREYRQIASVQIPLEELKALDTSGSLNSVFKENGDQFSAWVVGGKYYCIKVMFEFADVYTYENGTFTLMSDPPVRLNIPDSFTPCVKDIDIDEAIAEMKPPAEPYVQVSEDNEFIDFEFIENYQGTNDIGDLADKAVEFLKTTEVYSEITKYTDEISESELADYIDENGEIKPRFGTAFPLDYDGDGSTETFIVVYMPTLWGQAALLRSYIVFCGSSGKFQLLDDFGDSIENASLLDYGKYKHLIFGSYGFCGADSHDTVFGVCKGKGVVHDSGRVSYVKENCFLSSFGWQGSGDFMYFDTGANEYRLIQGKEVSEDELKKMDKDGVLDYYWENYLGFYITPKIELIGGKYYCFNYGFMTPGDIYTYENGKFVEQKQSGVRNSNYRYGRTVVDIDIEKAIAEMKKPQK
ncbi:MAG: hypothetical protein K2N71_04905, partial [Oscillospiraceae bacterium]|nr:hypothetical protein [Oscillospiraceae bacterium]